MKKIIVFGLSGITKGLVENIQHNHVKANIDYIYMDPEFKDSDHYQGIPIINDLTPFNGQYCVIPTFRHDLRKKWIRIADSLEMKPFDIIHNDSYVSKTVRFGKGCFIAQYTIIESNVITGDYFLAAYQNRIGHDSIIGDFCHVYVGANVGGFNKIGNNVSICSSSCTKENVSIGDNSIIGLGSTVFRDVPSNSTAIGNPAKCIKNL